MRIWTVARRELKALFDLPTGYVLLVVFLSDQWISLLPSGLSDPSGESQADAGCAALAVPLLRAGGHHAIAGGGHPGWPARGGIWPSP